MKIGKSIVFEVENQKDQSLAQKWVISEEKMMKSV